MSNNTCEFYLESENKNYSLQEGNNWIGRNCKYCSIHLIEKFIGRRHTNLVISHDRCHIQIFSILTLNEPIKFNAVIRPICIAKNPGFDLTDANATTIGMGRLHSGEKINLRLINTRFAKYSVFNMLTSKCFLGGPFPKFLQK